VNVQLFGTKKCQDSRRAERFFRERGCKLQVIDLGQKAMSAGELRSVAARVGGIDKLMDRDGRRYVDRGLKYAAPTGPRIEQMLVDDPLLLRTPIVRQLDGGTRATVGFSAETCQEWQQWIDESRKR